METELMIIIGTKMHTSTQILLLSIFAPMPHLGIYPMDPLETAICDMYIEECMDIFSEIFKVCF
jgi:hypothetical protein